MISQSIVPGSEYMKPREAKTSNLECVLVEHETALAGICSLLWREEQTCKTYSGSRSVSQYFCSGGFYLTVKKTTEPHVALMQGSFKNLEKLGK